MLFSVGWVVEDRKNQKEDLLFLIIFYFIDLIYYWQTRLNFLPHAVVHAFAKTNVEGS